MNPSCLTFQLSDAERRHVNERGYLVVPDALDRAMVDRHFSEGGRTELRAGFGASGLLFLSEAFLEMAKIPIPEDAPLSVGAMAHVGAEVARVDGQWQVTKAAMSRSARILMEGMVRIPAGSF